MNIYLNKKSFDEAALKHVAEYDMPKLMEIPEYRDAALKFAAEHNSIKPKGFEALEYIFSDKEQKHKYYTFPNIFHLPVDRFSAIELTISELQAGLAFEEKKDVYAGFRKAIDNILDSLRLKNKFDTKSLGQISLLLEETEVRRENLIHKDLMYKVMSLVYVRDDEDIYTIDSLIEKQKIELFKELAAEDGHAPFFRSRTLAALLPWSAMSEEELQKHLKESEWAEKRLGKILELIRSTGAG